MDGPLHASLLRQELRAYNIRAGKRFLVDFIGPWLVSFIYITSARLYLSQCYLIRNETEKEVGLTLTVLFQFLDFLCRVAFLYRVVGDLIKGWVTPPLLF